VLRWGVGGFERGEGKKGTANDVLYWEQDGAVLKKHKLILFVVGYCLQGIWHFIGD